MSKRTEKKKSKIVEYRPTSISRNSKETVIELDYDHVAPSTPGKHNVVLNIKARGDFSHHLIEDTMAVLNKLAELKGCGHKLV